MTARERLEAFELRIAFASLDSLRINTIGIAIGRVKRDLAFLEIAFAEYQAAAAELMVDHQKMWKREEGKLGTRKLTAVEVARRDESTRLAMVVFLRIHTIFFIAQRLLDGLVSLADTLLRPSSVSLGRRHSKVKRRLELMIETGEAPPADDLFPRIDQAERRITQYRDKYVAHPAHPPRFPEGLQTRVSVGLPYFTVDDEKPDLMTLLEDCVKAWIDYYEAIPMR